MLVLSWMTLFREEDRKGEWGLFLRGGDPMRGPTREKALWDHHLELSSLLWPQSQTADYGRQLVREAESDKEAVPTLLGTKDPSSHLCPPPREAAARGAFEPGKPRNLK